jgi:hypothetical protein
MQEPLISIAEVPVWTLIPFGLALVAALTWTVRWILRHPEPE